MRSSIITNNSYYRNLALALVPLLGTLLIIFVFGVNAPFFDDWWILQFLKKYDAQTLQFRDLFLPLNEHILAAPLLLFFALGKATAFNFKTFMVATQILWFLAFWGIYDRVYHRSGLRGKTLNGATLVLSFFWFNWRSSDSIVSGFQLSFLMALSFAILSCCFLDRFSESPRERKLAGLLALVFAILASYSTSSGLLAWPVGALYLILTPRFRAGAKLLLLSLWSFFALKVIFHYLKLTKKSYAAVQHGTSLEAYFKYYFTLLGNHLDHESFARGLGVVAFLLLILLAVSVLRRQKIAALAWELSLLSFPTALSLLMTWGRFHEVPAQALSNRYVICLVIFYAALVILAQRLFAQRWALRGGVLTLLILALLGNLQAFPHIYDESLSKAAAKQRLLKHDELPAAKLVGICYTVERVKEDAPFWMKHWRP